jgi:hypothetical protein
VVIRAFRTRDYIDEAGREDTAIWAVVDPEEICDRSKL